MSRGINNKNPFNIRKSSNPWRGKITSKDKDFEQFCSMVYGIRAGIILLRTYIQKYHIDTARKIIRRFAPPIENDTTSYLFFISTYLDLDKNIVFGSSDFVLLCHAIMLYESDYDCSTSYIYEIINQFKLNNFITYEAS